MIVALVAFPHEVEWLLERARKTPFLRSWYIQPVNFATHLVCSLAAWATFVATRSQLTVPVAATVAAFVYLTVNHYLVGQVLVLAGICTAALIHASPVVAIPIVLLLIFAQRQVARTLVSSTAQTQPARLAGAGRIFLAGNSEARAASLQPMRLCGQFYQRRSLREAARSAAARLTRAATIVSAAIAPAASIIQIGYAPSIFISGATAALS
jgi:hypothetical protein